MRCPYCGFDLQEGYLQSQSPMAWSDEKLDGAYLFMVKEHGGFDGFHVTKNILRPNAIPSQYCESCGLLITRLKRER